MSRALSPVAKGSEQGATVWKLALSDLGVGRGRTFQKVSPRGAMVDAGLVLLCRRAAERRHHVLQWYGRKKLFYGPWLERSVLRLLADAAEIGKRVQLSATARF